MLINQQINYNQEALIIKSTINSIALIELMVLLTVYLFNSSLIRKYSV